MKSLYIFYSSCRGANYGVGTYIQQLLDVVEDSDYKVNVINLFAEESPESSVEEKDGIRLFKIATPRVGRNSLEILSVYYRNVYYFLAPYISEEDEIIFHFNMMQGEELLQLLRSKFKCRTLLTVHYMGWSFSLLGDIVKLQSVIANSVTEQDRVIKESFEYEQQFIKKNIDHVIAIAQHSCNTLCSIYDIPASQITIISNGLKDQYRKLSEKEKKAIRKSFRFRDDEILLVFAGRLDEVKGVRYLLRLLNIVMASVDNIRLIISGDGNFQSCFDSSYPNWSKVVYTGFISKDKLYGLYSIADIGIVPSLHEEFGYVALEMMMNGLPLIVNNTTGLSEIVQDGVNGLYITIDPDENKLDVSAYLLSEKIKQLSMYKNDRRNFVREGRSCFLQKYDHILFKKKMLALYDSLFLQIN